MDACAGSNLIEDVNCLVWQETVLDVAARKRNSSLDSSFGVVDVVVLLIAVLKTVDNRNGVVGVWLADVDWLETPLKCSVLLDMFTVLFCRSCTDDLDFSTRQWWLQDGRSIDGALCGASTNDGVNLVDEEDVILGFLQLSNNLLHAVLKLTAILGSCYQTCQVKRPNLLSAQDVRNVAGCNELSQALDNGGLTNARISQDKWVVLLATCKNLHDTLNLAVTTNNGVKLFICGKLSKVAAKLLQHRSVVVCVRTHLTSSNRHAKNTTLNARLCHTRTSRCIIWSLGNKLIDGVSYRVARDTHSTQGIHSAAITLGHNTQEQVLCCDIALTVGHSFSVRVLKYALCARSKRNVAARNRVSCARGELFYGCQGLVVRDLQLSQSLSSNTLPLFDESK